MGSTRSRRHDEHPANRCSGLRAGRFPRATLAFRCCGGGADGYSAPEVTRQAPDGRSDIFSLGAVLYTMLAGYSLMWGVEIATGVDDDPDLDSDLKAILLKRLIRIPPALCLDSGVSRVLAAYLEENVRDDHGRRRPD